MKLITNLQSYTDVITNSSSTVFIMHKDDAKFYEKDTPGGYCTIERIDHQWILNNIWEWELVFDFLNIDKNTISAYIKDKRYSFWEDPDEDLWRLWVDDNLSLLQEKLFGLYYVSIEDHFEGAYEYIESASNDALKTEWRH